MLTYSIAIRTLATNPEILKQELESLKCQTVSPDKVVVYLAQDYERPNYQVGKEEYVWVKKGMMAQRLLDYNEIDSDVIMMLDDDVELAPSSAEQMLKAMEEHSADCVAADTFKNYKMTIKEKVISFVTNWVYERQDDGWAFRINRSGSFSYNKKPSNHFYLTESFAGPCWMVKKSILKEIQLKEELWLDNIGFPYGEDALESYKFFLNGYKCGVLFDSGVKNLDAKTSSGAYHKNDKKLYTRSFGIFATWWRMIYTSRDKRWLSASLFGLKAWWQLNLHILLGVAKLNIRIPYNYINGLKDGWDFVHSDEYKAIPPYIIRKNAKADTD